MIGIFAGFYLMVNALAPALLDAVTPADATAKKLVSTPPTNEENRAYIPKINVDVAIVPVKGEESVALEKGAIQRSESSGNPRDGGNFVLTANRYNLGLTPMQTKTQSPFYHLNKLGKGDDIFVDYHGIRYAYQVEERKFVSLAAPEVEAATSENRLTMYATSGAGHEVVIAKPIGKIVWQSGKPLLKSL
jgi:LPXTG-site transpeptidase (sortase) family protein